MTHSMLDPLTDRDLAPADRATILDQIADAPETRVIQSERRTNPRGAGVLTMTGPSREAVHEAAMRAFGALQQEWRSPSYTGTNLLPDGQWRATISYWSVE